jgi:hypothetical protein
VTAPLRPLRTHPQDTRARLAVTIVLALRLLVPGKPALAEEEPAARAALPPPLAIPSPPEAGAPQKPAETSSPAAPRMRFDRSRAQPAERKSHLTAAAHRGRPGARGRDASPRHRDLAVDKASRHAAQGAIAFGGQRGRGGSPTEPEIGHLSPPSVDSTPRVENAPMTRIDPARIAVPFYSGPYGYIPSIPYSWLPPGAEYYR